MAYLSKQFLNGILLSFGLGSSLMGCASDSTSIEIQRVVTQAVTQTMGKNKIPGVSVGLVIQGRTYTFNYGLASVKDKKPVTNNTLFEIGSVSKTFTASLASYAQINGNLKLSDSVAKHIPELMNTDFGKLQLYHLGTHTTGGLPLQVPDAILTETQLIHYFQTWKPQYKTGEIRTYANPSAGTLGLIAAKSMHQKFSTAMSHEIFEPLELENTFFNIPSQKLKHYAFGYNTKNMPVRVNPGILSDESYGIKTTAYDLTRFLKANMGMITLDHKRQNALNQTRQGYFKVGEMTQDLIWEEYTLPVELQTLQKGNSAVFIYSPTPVSEMNPSSAPKNNVWINKTGSTNGFGAYVVFVPKEHFAIAILANKNYPNEERVALAYAIYKALLH